MLKTEFARSDYRGATGVPSPSGSFLRGCKSLIQIGLLVVAARSGRFLHRRFRVSSRKFVKWPDSNAMDGVRRCPDPRHLLAIATGRTIPLRCLGKGGGGTGFRRCGDWLVGRKSFRQSRYSGSSRGEQYTQAPVIASTLARKPVIGRAGRHTAFVTEVEH